MTKLSEALQKIRDELGMHDTAFGAHLGIHKTVLSRILSGSREVGRETVARLLVSLDESETERVLQAHFQDELERIGSMRADKAAELGMKLAEPMWPYIVQVSGRQVARRRR